MPIRRPSSVEAITRAAAPPKGDPMLHDLDVADEHERAQRKPPAKPVPVRVTLNIPPDLYRDFLRWLDRQADVSEVPKIDIQKGLRGLMRGVIGSPEATEAVGRGLYNEIRGGKIA